MFFAWANIVSAQIVNIPDANFKAKLVSANQWNFIAFDLAGNMTVIDNNGDGEIQVSEAQNISQLSLNFTNITDFTGIKSFSNLEIFTIQHNNADYLDVSNMIHLKDLFIGYNNDFENLNIQGCTSLENLNISFNYFTNLNFLQCPSLKKLTMHRMLWLSAADLSGVPNLEELTIESDNYNNNFTSLNLSVTPNLKKLILDKTNLNSINLNGITNLEHLVLKNSKLTNVNLSAAGNSLKYLFVENNTLLTQLNIQNCTALETLLVLENNVLQTLDTHNKPVMNWISLSGSPIQSLDFSGSDAVGSISINNLPLTSINLTNLSSLYQFHGNSVNFTSLDLSQNSALHNFGINNCPINSINMKSGQNTQYISLANVPNLQYICADDGELSTIAASLPANQSCTVNSYCTFTPGGNYYTLQGKTTYDENTNGCDSNDINKPLQKFSITSTGSSGFFIANASGNYNVPVSAGTHTITPVLENPAYFSITPSSFVADFPTQASPLLQNFCMTPAGNFNDLEVTVLPLNNARPGFAAHYKLLLKNKGTTTQSAPLHLMFDDAVMNYASSSIAPNSVTTGDLLWNFSNLHPFETKEITLTFVLNTPVATPPLNGGSILQYTATFTGQTDETPSDNTFALNQTVVNSFDPNDKTCLQGTQITETKVGDYVHYMIRFENTGTANAENIVVKDVIDTSKFEINSLTTLNGSHSFVTRITNGNTAEFIFENIQLPFDDANNDGFITFKIKTKSTLALGDSFSNTAAIYFDYNAPIITNTFTTTVANMLATQEVKNDEEIAVFPNPVINILHFRGKEVVLKVEIYDQSGRIISSLPVTRNEVNLDHLKTGTYLLKIFTKENNFTKKIIKK